MILVFFIIGILFLLVALILLSKLELNINRLDLSNIDKHKNNEKLSLQISFLIGKFKWFKITINKEKLAWLYVKIKEKEASMDLNKVKKDIEQDFKIIYEDVELRKKILLTCDGTITTTTKLKKKKKKLGIPVFMNPNSASMKMVEHSLACGKEQSDKVKIGYFSGSKTHMDDLNMILPVLKEILSKYSQVELFLTGELDLPQELLEYQNQITMRGFVNWKDLPNLISFYNI